jgi:hypothetical protein
MSKGRRRRWLQFVGTVISYVNNIRVTSTGDTRVLSTGDTRVTNDVA